MEIRKLKEMEYEIITSTIKGWEGEVSTVQWNLYNHLTSETPAFNTPTGCYYHQLENYFQY